MDAVGEGVTRFAPGDRLVRLAPGGVGAHTEYPCVPADRAIASIPDGIAFTKAVVCEGVWYANTYIDAFALGPNHRILVYGASGAVGSAAMQLAKARGAEVTAVVDTRHLDLAHSLGADRLVDYTAEDYTRVENGLAFVRDAVGKTEFQRARTLLKPEGVFSATDLGPRNQNLWHWLRSPLMRTRRFVSPLPKDPR